MATAIWKKNKKKSYQRKQILQIFDGIHPHSLFTECLSRGRCNYGRNNFCGLIIVVCVCSSCAQIARKQETEARWAPKWRLVAVGRLWRCLRHTVVVVICCLCFRDESPSVSAIRVCTRALCVTPCSYLSARWGQFNFNFIQFFRSLEKWPFQLRMCI